MESKREFTIAIEKDTEGYYVATVPQLKGCHAQAKTLDELMERIKEAVLLCLEAEAGEGVESLELVGIQKIAI